MATRFHDIKFWLHWLLRTWIQLIIRSFSSLSHSVYFLSLPLCIRVSFFWFLPTFSSLSLAPPSIAPYVHVLELATITRLRAEHGTWLWVCSSVFVHARWHIPPSWIAIRAFEVILSICRRDLKMDWRRSRIVVESWIWIPMGTSWTNTQQTFLTNHCRCGSY